MPLTLTDATVRGGCLGQWLESGFLSVGKHRCFCVGAGVIF